MSKTFRFRLKRLLDLRRLEEREAEGLAIAAASRAADLEETCAVLMTERERLSRDLPNAAARNVDRQDEIRLLIEHSVRLDESLRRLSAERDLARTAAAMAEAERARRRSARRALEELETRSSDQWNEELRRLETIEIDEIAATRFFARRDAAEE